MAKSNKKQAQSSIEEFMYDETSIHEAKQFSEIRKQDKTKKKLGNIKDVINKTLKKKK